MIAKLTVQENELNEFLYICPSDASLSEMKTEQDRYLQCSSLSIHLYTKKDLPVRESVLKLFGDNGAFWTIPIRANYRQLEVETKQKLRISTYNNLATPMLIKPLLPLHAINLVRSFICWRYCKIAEV